jgi:hypothetical protein
VGVCGVALALVACATQAPVDTATPPPVLGLTDPPNAISYSAWAFAVPSRTHGYPGAAARAVAALDYEAGALNTDPVYKYLSPIVNVTILQAREQTRSALGILPTATSQQVVNALTTVYVALANDDRARAFEALSSPIFTLGPERTMALLNNLPFIRAANIATMQALGALSAPGNSSSDVVP